MQFSNQCTDFISEFEGFRSRPYQDSNKIWTIGFGTTYYCTDLPVHQYDPPINLTRGKQELLCHLNKVVLPEVQHVKVPLNQNQVDALGCLIYNIGDGHFERSHLLIAINSGAPVDEIKKHWLEWDIAGGQVLPGLLHRRQKEFELFIKPV